jgi:hypothetical protein
MSRFLHLAKRYTESVASIFDGTMVASPTIGAWPTGVTGRCKVTVSSVTGHTDCVGTITIGGETLTFSAGLTPPITKQTTVNLTAKPTVSSSDLDCHCHITVIDSGGADVMVTTETDLPCKIEIKTKSVPSPAGGWTSISSTQMQARGIFEVGDRIKFDVDYPFDPTNGTEYSVVSERPKVAHMGKESIKILTF